MPKFSFLWLRGELVFPTRRRRNTPNPNPDYEEEESEEGAGKGSDDGDGDGDGDGDEGEVTDEEDALLPDSDVFISMVYPPALYIKEETPEKIPSGLKRPCVHGLWQVKSLAPPLQNKINRDEVKKYELSPELKSEINRLVPALTDEMTNEEHLKKEFTKHAPDIVFLPTVPEYITFALEVYERYEFVRLTDFVVSRIEDEGIGEPVRFYGMTWQGVRLEDFIRIVHSYTPIRPFKDSIGIQLLKTGDRHIFYEISMNFTKHKMPAMRCRRTPEVYINKRSRTAKLSPDLRVIMIGNKVRKQNSSWEAGECSTSKSNNK